MTEQTSAYFDLGKVVSRTVDTIRENLPVLASSAAILVGIPSLVAAYGERTGEVSGMVISGIASLFIFVGSVFLQGAVIQITVNNARGRQTSISEALGIGARMAGPLVGLSLVIFGGVVLGTLLLIVPGIILAVMWMVSAPALIVERAGIFDSLRRSSALTKNHRWALFGLTIAYVIAATLVNLVVVGIAGATGAIAVYVILSAVVQIAQGIIGSVGVAIIYHQLREVKEGVGPEQIASIFD